MARSGDVKNQVVVLKSQKNKNANGDRHQPCKNAVEGQQGSDCDHMGAHKGLAHVDE